MNRPTASTEWGHQRSPCWRRILKVLRYPRRVQSVGPQKGDPQTPGKSSNNLGFMQMRTLSSPALQDPSVRATQCLPPGTEGPETVASEKSIRQGAGAGPSRHPTRTRTPNCHCCSSEPGSTVRKHLHATKKSTATTDLGKKGFNTQIISIIILIGCSHHGTPRSPGRD